MCLSLSSKAEIRTTAENRNKLNANINGHLLFLESLISGIMTMSDGLMIYWNHNSFVYVSISAPFLVSRNKLAVVFFLFYMIREKKQYFQINQLWPKIFMNKKNYLFLYKTNAHVYNAVNITHEIILWYSLVYFYSFLFFWRHS